MAYDDDHITSGHSGGHGSKYTTSNLTRQQTHPSVCRWLAPPTAHAIFAVYERFSPLKFDESNRGAHAVVPLARTSSTPLVVQGGCRTRVTHSHVAALCSRRDGASDGFALCCASVSLLLLLLLLVLRIIYW